MHEELDGAADFEIGVYLEVSDDVNYNRERAEYFLRLKEFGVQSVTLGPTYDLNIIEQFLPFAEQTGIALHSSLMFLKSVTMVRYLNNLPGVPSVPQEFLKKLIQAPDKKNAGMRVAADFYRELAAISDGVVLPVLLTLYYVLPYQRATGILAPGGSLDRATGEIALMVSWSVIWIALGVFAIRYILRAYAPASRGPSGRAPAIFGRL